jgi:hypothetical protein
MIVMLVDASSGFKAENDALTKKGKEVPNHQPAAAYAGRDHQATTGTTLQQQHSIHLCC